MELEKDMEYLQKLAAFADLSHKIYRTTGLRPTDFETIDAYMRAVIAATHTESLASWDCNENGSVLDEIVRTELKTRGEI